MKLDIKNLKKVHSDAHSTTLSHSSGHKILIAHGALSPAMRKQVDAIPHYSDGGYVEDKDRMKQEPAKQGKSPDRPEPSISYDEALKRLNATPTGYADGGEVEQDEAPGAMDTRTDSEKAVSNEMDQAQSAPPPTSFEPDASQMQNPAVPQAMPAAMPDTADQQASALDSVNARHQKALQAEASAVGEQGDKEADVEDARQLAMEALNTNFDEQNKQIFEERQKVLDDYSKGHINPHQWWENKSIGGKIMTAIGLILGGMGAQATGGRNVVLDIINKQIDNDIDAQKTEMGKKQNMMGALTQQLGDVRQATMMNKMLKLDQVQAQLGKAAAESKDPIAKARAEQAMLQLRQQSALLHTQLSHTKAIDAALAKGQLQPEQAVPLKVPKEMQGKVLETMGKVRSLDSMEQSSLNAFDHISGLTGRGLMSPNDAKSAKQAFIGKLIKETEGRYNYEAAQNLADALFPNRSDVGKTVANKRARMQELFTSMRKEHESTLMGVGLPIARPGQGFSPRK